jgi:hypothetical protein
MRNAIHKVSSEKNGDTTPLDYVGAIGSFKEAEALLLR